MSILGLFVKNSGEYQSIGLYMGPQFCFIDQWVLYYSLKSSD